MLILREHEKVLVSSNNRFCICFEISLPKPVISHDSCVKMSSLVVSNKGSKNKQKHVLANRHKSQFLVIRNKNLVEV